MTSRAQRRSRLRWAAAAIAAALIAGGVLVASWGGGCASLAEGVEAWTDCSTGPRLGVASVFILLVDLVFGAYAVSRVRRKQRL